MAGLNLNALLIEVVLLGVCGERLGQLGQGQAFEDHLGQDDLLQPHPHRLGILGGGRLWSQPRSEQQNQGRREDFGEVVHTFRTLLVGTRAVNPGGGMGERVGRNRIPIP